MSAAELVARLAKEGIDPTLLAEVAQELFAGEMERANLAKRRENERNRQSKKRGVTGCHVTERDDTGQDVTPSLEVSPHTPLPKPNPSPPYSPPASRSSGKRGTRLANDFEVPEDWIAWAMNKRGWSRADATEEAECFVRYWQAKPGREACKLDWPKTWQNWTVNSRRQASTGPPASDGFLAHITAERKRREEWQRQQSGMA